MRQREFIDGRFQVPLPDDAAARARVFGEVAQAWSIMLSSIRHLLNGNQAPPSLFGEVVRPPAPDIAALRREEESRREVTAAMAAPAKPNGERKPGKGKTKRGRRRQ